MIRKKLAELLRKERKMAELFTDHNQAKQYADGRPNYPPELFQFIASKTPAHDLVWDVGTGSGQAAQSLAAIYKKVIATDTSLKQLEFAPKLPNIIYKQTPPTLSITEVEQKISTQGTIDLVTIAQALHWFDLKTFYKNIKFVLKKPHGVIAAWCYSLPEVSSSVDAVLRRFYGEDLKPYWDGARRLVDEEYKTIEFPFEGVDGEDETGPFRLFVAEKCMEFEEYLTYLRSWSAYQTAKENGLELLTRERVEEFEAAWNEDGKKGKKVAKFPIHLRMGKVGSI